jgi:hypothetical protein
MDFQAKPVLLYVPSCPCCLTLMFAQRSSWLTSDAGSLHLCIHQLVFLNPLNASPFLFLAYRPHRPTGLTHLCLQPTMHSFWVPPALPSPLSCSATDLNGGLLAHAFRPRRLLYRTLGYWRIFPQSACVRPLRLLLSHTTTASTSGLAQSQLLKGSRSGDVWITQGETETSAHKRHHLSLPR